MKLITYIFLLAAVSLASQAQTSSDSVSVTNPKIFHISTHAYINDNIDEQLDILQKIDTLTGSFGELLTLSITSKELFINWEEQADLYSEGYSESELLIIVSSDETSQKLDFLTEFYRRLTNGNTIKEAYRLALSESMYLSEIKHAYYPKMKATNSR